METDPLKIDEEHIKAAKRTHAHRDKELLRKEQDEPPKPATGDDKPKKIQKLRRELGISDTIETEDSTNIINKQHDAAEMKCAETICIDYVVDDAENAKKEIKLNSKTKIEDCEKKFKHKHKNIKTNRRHHMEMELSTKDKPKKDKHAKEEDSKVRDKEKPGVANRESKTVKTVGEVSKGNANPIDNTKRKTPKKEKQSTNKTEDSQESAQNTEIKIKVKANPQNNNDAANVR